jgi:hypothetical protein
MHVSAEMPPRPNAQDSLGALVPGSVARIAGNPQPNLPLAGRRFVVKDVIDVAGFVTGAGNPDWARTHAPATVHAAVVQLLLDRPNILLPFDRAEGCTGEARRESGPGVTVPGPTDQWMESGASMRSPYMRSSTSASSGASCLPLDRRTFIGGVASAMAMTYLSLALWRGYESATHQSPS